MLQLLEPIIISQNANYLMQKKKNQSDNWQKAALQNQNRLQNLNLS